MITAKAAEKLRISARIIRKGDVIQDSMSGKMFRIRSVDFEAGRAVINVEKGGYFEVKNPSDLVTVYRGVTDEELERNNRYR